MTLLGNASALWRADFVRLAAAETFYCRDGPRWTFSLARAISIDLQNALRKRFASTKDPRAVVPSEENPAGWVKPLEARNQGRVRWFSADLGSPKLQLSTGRCRETRTEHLPVLYLPDAGSQGADVSTVYVLVYRRRRISQKAIS
jgi:hypothetical protein